MISGSWPNLDLDQLRVSHARICRLILVVKITSSLGISCRVNCASSRTSIMDFMPLPDGLTSHEPIPDLGGPDYDNKGFLGYDERQGWNLKALRNGDLENARSDWEVYTRKRLENAHSKDFENTREDSQATRQNSAASFIQTWILYGIFQEALNRPVLRNEASIMTVLDPQEKAGLVGCNKMQSDALSEGFSGKGKAGKTRCITVRSLFQELLENLKNSQKEIDDISPWAIRLLNCASEVTVLLSDVDTPRFSIMPPVVDQALSVVIESIFASVSALLPSKTVDRLLDGRFIRRPKFLIAKLEGRRWCRSLIERLSWLGIGGLYYASLFPESPSGRHSECQIAVCTASNIDRDKYRVQHVPEDCHCKGSSCDHIQPMCGCRSISMPETELHAAFVEEGFPVVRFQDDQIKIVRFTPDVKYVALSHVWADGRGNPFSNALPMCQLQMIDRCVGEVYPNTERLFWIDTLCVPIQEPLKKMAILRMARVYSSAACVLVLSAELLSTNLPKTHDETMFRIFCSTWNTRLWTMQEGMLVSDLAFQFKNGAVRFGRLVQESKRLLSKVTDECTCHMVSLRATNWLQESLTMPIPHPGRLSVAGFCRALRFRSTSKLSDVAICGSVLLGSDLRQVLDTPDDRKMETFWKCQKEVSVGILWYAAINENESLSRFNQDGLRWAPTNLLEVGRILTESLAAEITATGLLVNGVEAILMENVALPDTMAELGMLYFRFGIPGSPQIYVAVVQGHDIQVFSDVRNLCAGQLVLLLMQLPKRHQGINPSALVMPVGKITNDVGTLISARYLCPAYTFAGDGNIYHRLSFQEEEVRRRQGFIEITETRQIPSARRWHIL